MGFDFEDYILDRYVIMQRILNIMKIDDSY